MFRPFINKPQAHRARLISSSSGCSSSGAIRLLTLKLPGSSRCGHVTPSTSWNGASNGYVYGQSSSSGNSNGNGIAGGNNTNNSSSGFTPSPASTWEEEGSSGWQDYQNADWGTTYQPGDWGEPGKVNPATGPDNAYNQQQQQQQQQYGFSDAAAASSSSSAGFGSSFPDDFSGAAQQQQQQQAGDGRWPFADSTQQQQQQRVGVRGGGIKPPMVPSDITLLGRRDAVRVLVAQLIVLLLLPAWCMSKAWPAM
jgi:hypothetical protein